MGTKQGYALKNWVEVLSDEAHYPWESQKNRLKSVNPTKECFDLSMKANFRVF